MQVAALDTRCPRGFNEDPDSIGQLQPDQRTLLAGLVRLRLLRCDFVALLAVESLRPPRRNVMVRAPKVLRETACTGAPILNRSRMGSDFL